MAVLKTVEAFVYWTHANRAALYHVKVQHSVLFWRLIYAIYTPESYQSSDRRDTLCRNLVEGAIVEAHICLIGGKPGLRIFFEPFDFSL